MKRAQTSNVLPGPERMIEVPAIINVLKRSVRTQSLLAGEQLRIGILT
jgi:hypothetical protein